MLVLGVTSCSTLRVHEMSVGVFMSGWTPPGTSFAVLGIGAVASMVKEEVVERQEERREMNGERDGEGERRGGRMGRGEEEEERERRDERENKRGQKKRKGKKGARREGRRERLAWRGVRMCVKGVWRDERNNK